MKGTVLKCLNELVKEKFGEERWRDVLADAGLSRDTFYSPTQDLPDEQAYRVIGSTCGPSSRRSKIWPMWTTKNR